VKRILVRRHRPFVRIASSVSVCLPAPPLATDGVPIRELGDATPAASRRPAKLRVIAR